MNLTRKTLSPIFASECNYRTCGLQVRMNTGITKGRRQKSTAFSMVGVIGFEPASKADTLQTALHPYIQFYAHFAPVPKTINKKAALSGFYPIRLIIGPDNFFAPSSR